MTQKAASSSPVVWTTQDLHGDPHIAADKAQRVRRMFAAIARRYDFNNRVHSFGRDQYWRRSAVRLCRVNSTDHVLDVACGTGDLAIAFAQAGAASVTGVDFTEEMLELARAKIGDSVRFIHADAMALPFDDQSFDIVSIAFGIRNVVDPLRALSEFRRVLRPEGRLVILEFTRPRLPILRGLNDFYTGCVMPITATLISGDRSGAYRYLPRSIATFLDESKMRSAMEHAGFSGVTAQPMTFGVCTAYLGHVPRNNMAETSSAETI